MYIYVWPHLLSWNSWINNDSIFFFKISILDPKLRALFPPFHRPIPHFPPQKGLCLVPPPEHSVWTLRRSNPLWMEVQNRHQVFLGSNLSVTIWMRFWMMSPFNCLLHSLLENKYVTFKSLFTSEKKSRKLNFLEQILQKMTHNCRNRVLVWTSQGHLNYVSNFWRT